MFNSNRDRYRAEYARKCYPAGTKIRLIDMNDPYDPVPSGTIGTVACVTMPGSSTWTGRMAARWRLCRAWIRLKCWSAPHPLRGAKTGVLPDELRRGTRGPGRPLHIGGN